MQCDQDAAGGRISDSLMLVSIPAEISRDPSGVKRTGKGRSLIAADGADFPAGGAIPRV